MTIFSQICFSQQPVVPAEETVLCSALAEWVRPIWPHRPMPAPAQHRGILPSETMHRAPAAQLSGFHAFHSKNGRTRCIKPAP